MFGHCRPNLMYVIRCDYGFSEKLRNHLQHEQQWLYEKYKTYHCPSQQGPKCKKWQHYNRSQSHPASSVGQKTQPDSKQRYCPYGWTAPYRAYGIVHNKYKPDAADRQVRKQHHFRKSWVFHIISFVVNRPHMFRKSQTEREICQVKKIFTWW